LPSLATVVDLFRPELEKTWIAEKELLLSDLWNPHLLAVAAEAVEFEKKFFSFCGKGLCHFACLLDVIEWPEKFRFSLGGNSRRIAVENGRHRDELRIHESCSRELSIRDSRERVNETTVVVDARVGPLGG